MNKFLKNNYPIKKANLISKKFLTKPVYIYSVVVILLVVNIIFAYLFIYSKNKQTDEMIVCLGANKIQCWQNALEKSLDTNEGITEAMLLFEEFFKDEQFASNCHGFTHLIGEKAYEEYKKNSDVELSSKASYCSYGVFHGFIEAMYISEGNLEQARGFCDYIDRRLKKETETLGACLHGIGHGFTDGGDPRAWGNEDAIIDPGLKLCDEIGNDDYERKICGTGVFNALAIMYNNPQYKLNLDRSNPYKYCSKVEKTYFKSACYDDFKTLPMIIEDNNFKKATSYLEAIPETEYSGPALDNLATYAVYFMTKDKDINDAVAVCQSLQTRHRTYCIAGLGAGLMTSGVPDKEYIRALQLCKSDLLNDEEISACYFRVLNLVSNRYSDEKKANNLFRR